MIDKKQIKLTLVKSTNGRIASHKACVRGLGLRRMHHSAIVEDTAEHRGMISKVSYLLEIKEA